MSAISSTLITPGRVWLTLFVYSATVALLLQLAVLPLFLPQLHAGNGLLMGGDWVGFHQIAAEMAAEIYARGWSAWELRPRGHSPAGIAAAIYALTGISEPYMLIPLNAAVHATAGVALMRIVRYLTNDDVTALCAALPFVLFPSSMAWYAQIQKDGLYFTGAFLCLYGWILLARLQTWQQGWQPVAVGLACLGAGVALMGLVRIYSFQVMQAMGLIFAMGLTMLFVMRGAKGQLPWKMCAAAIVILFLVPLLLRFAPTETRGSSELLNDTRGGSELLDDTRSSSGSGGAELVAKKHWRKTAWLPRPIETSFFRLAVLREGYLSAPAAHKKNAGTNIDIDVRLSSADDFVAYLPRAVQIGFLAPFPGHWVASGTSPGGSIMRRLAGAEMIGVYCALLFLPYAIWHWRRKVEIWLPTVFGAVLVMVYAFVTPNLGTLYRLRYGFLMVLVAIGVTGAITAWRDFRSPCFPKTQDT